VVVVQLHWPWTWSERKKEEISETKLLLKRIIGQKLLGVTVDSKYKEWQLHFEDFVVFVSDPFPSPIVERIPWKSKGA
jgi:hypothetical protein